MATKSPAKIAESLPHNVRALLLRLLCRRPYQDRPAQQEFIDAMASAKRRKLAEWPDDAEDPRLTPLGVDVASAIKPREWVAETRTIAVGAGFGAREVARTQIKRPSWTGDSVKTMKSCLAYAFTVDSDTHEPNLGERIVDLLNADDLAKAMAYELVTE